MNFLKKNIDSKIFLIIFTAIIVATSLIGGVMNFSPVPFWDMWDGTLNFYIRVNSGDYSAWWYQHNEHRIVLARILFYLDYRYFGGYSISLIIENYLFIIIACYIFWLYSKEIINYNLRIKLILIITSLLFLCTQSNNLFWGFQVQFFLAQLLPLASLYFLSISDKNKSKYLYFSLSIFFGFLSAWTMANGVMILPLMILYLIVLKESALRILVTIAATIFTFCLYFSGYHSPAGHGDLIYELTHKSFDYLAYIFLYLGSPFYFIFNSSYFGKAFAFISGFLFFSASLLLMAEQLLNKKAINRINYALLTYIFYIIITAFLTAGGRLIFGVDQALSSRYTTPVLMAYSAFILIFSKNHVGLIRLISSRFLMLFICVVCALTLCYQIKAVIPSDDFYINRNISALALSLDIRDEEYIGHIYPFIDTAMDIARIAVQKKYSIFSGYPYSSLGGNISEKASLPFGSSCIGNLESAEEIDGEEKYIRVKGWLLDPNGASNSDLIKFVDSSNKIVGYALRGFRRDDVSLEHGSISKYSGFKGYILKSKASSPYSAFFDSSNSCFFALSTVAPPYFLSPPLSKSRLHSSNITINDVDFSNGWSGSDYSKSNLPGVVVLGTFTSSDADIGRIALHAKRGDRLLYRSGPTGGNQSLEFLGGQRVYSLPVSNDWVILSFDGPNVPNYFDFAVVDNGKSWGEWSAIGLLK